MALFGKYFTFAGKNSNDYNLIISSFDKIDEVEMGLVREVETGEMNWYRYSTNHYGAKYTEPLKFEVAVIKDFCKPNYTSDFTRNELREITAWLTSPIFPELFHMYDYDNEHFADCYVDYYATVTEVKSTFVNGIVGLTFTLQCDCPFGYSQEYTVNLQNGTPVNIVNTSDNRESSIYPTITINPLDNNEIKIYNRTQNKVFKLKPFGQNDTIYVDCQNMTIKSKTGNLIPLYNLNIIDPVNIYWFELINGTNEVLLDGNATVTIKYREYRKVGAY